MLDFFLGKTIYEKFTDTTDTKTDTTATTATTDTTATTATTDTKITPTVTAITQNTTSTKSSSSSIYSIIGGILLVAIGGYAAYLSWTANTLAKWGTVAKVIYSFFAFFGGITYLISYFIYKLDLVNVIETMNQTVNEVYTMTQQV